MRQAFYIITLFSCLLSSCFCFAENQSNADSLLKKLSTHSSGDTLHVQLLNLLSWEYERQGEYEKSFSYAQQALALCEKLLNESPVAEKIRKSSLKEKANSLHNIGIVFWRKNEYAQALDYELKALAIREKLGLQEDIAASLNSIALIYLYTEQHDQSLKYFNMALSAAQSSGKKRLIAVIKGNMGTVYSDLGDYDKSLEHYLQALAIAEEINDKLLIARMNNNIGNIYSNKKDYNKAYNYLIKALQLKKELNDKMGIANGLLSIGNIFYKRNELDSTVSYCNKSMSVSREIGTRNIIAKAYTLISDIYAKQNNYKPAYEYHKLKTELNDSIFNEESSKQIAEMQTKYETEKKEQKIAMLNKDKELQQTIIWFVTSGLFLVVIFAGFIVRAYLQIKKKNKKINEQKQKIEEKQKEILDSIRYAKRIQDALLPRESYIDKTLKRLMKR